MAFLAGKEEKSPRDGFMYWSDDGDFMPIRMGRYEIVFASSDVGVSMFGANRCR